MSDPFLVRLTRREMSDARQAASGRWQLCRASGVVNQKKSNRSDADLDLLGVKSEIAVAKVLGVDYNPYDMGIDDGMDMWFGDRSIDVKATFHQTGRLILKSADAFRADCAILVTESEDDTVLRIIGGCSRDRFKAEASYTDIGYGKRWVMEQNQLSPIEVVWRSLKETHLG